jgi:zinc transport system substrate-binding protein
MSPQLEVSRMKKVVVLAVCVLLLGVTVATILSGCAQDDSDKLKVVTTTSRLECIVENVGGDRVEVVNIIPPAQCPGHFDVTPQDMQKLADADLFFRHGWQGEQFSQDLIDSADNPDLTVVTSQVAGNWMTPTAYSAAIDEVEAALSQADSANSEAYSAAAQVYKNAIETAAAEAEGRLSTVNLSEVKVLCAEQQDGFVRWTGLSIVATYGTTDSPAVVADLVDKGIEGNVTLVIDNLQSGQDAGVAIAGGLDCGRVILSNFPGGFDNTETWQKTLDHNVDLILAAVGA